MMYEQFDSAMTGTPVLPVTIQGERGDLFVVKMRMRGLGEKRSSARPSRKIGWCVAFVRVGSLE